MASTEGDVLDKVLQKQGHVESGGSQKRFLLEMGSLLEWDPEDKQGDLGGQRWGQEFWQRKWREQSSRGWKETQGHVSEACFWAMPCEGEGQDVPKGRPVAVP